MNLKEKIVYFKDKQVRMLALHLELEPMLAKLQEEAKIEGEKLQALYDTKRKDLMADFEKVVHDILEDLKFLDQNSRILRRVSAIGTGRFFTDVVRLKIILNNLISNAFKYHNPEAKNPFIEVKIKYDNQKAVIKVTDNGLGIAEQHLQNIFKMFYRANENSQGSGLGLYIVKETVEKIRGTIEVHSKIREGTEFEITIPSAGKPIG